jgi:hypothetical protein
MEHRLDRELDKEEEGHEQEFVMFQGGRALASIADRYTGLEEAPFSVNFTGIHPDGWRMQFTFRSREGKEGFKNLKSEMKQFTKEGRSWYSHNIGEGQWCKGK